MRRRGVHGSGWGLVVTARVAAGVLWLFALPAFAQSAQRDLDIERFEPALDGRGFIGVQGTRTPGAGMPSLGLVTHYGSSLLAAETAGGDEVQLVEHRLAGALLAELGIGPRAAVGFAAPFIVYQDGDGLVQSTPAAHSTALGDARVSARYRFIGDVPKDALSNDDGPGLALMVTGIVPGGDDEAFAGEGAFRLDAQLLADVHLLGSGAGASVGVRHRFERRELFNAHIHDEFTFGAALRLPIPPLHPLQAMVEVRGATDFRSAATTAVEGQLGLWLPLGEFALVLAGGPGFTGGIGVPGVRVVAGLWWAPTEHDADHDGVADAKDQCPPLPEDLDQFQDADGCPDPDNDNDLIPDADDLCPNIEALEDHDDDEDGCTDK